MNCLRWARKQSACPDAIKWLETLPADADRAYVWRRCKRSDWLLWMLREAGLLERYERELRLYAVSSARRALKRERAAGREPDPRSWEALRVATRCAEGQATREELREAWAAASDAAGDAAGDAACAAARDAARDAALHAAGTAAWDAACAAASDAAEAAAWAAAKVAAWERERRLQAASLRRLIPEWPGGAK